MPPLAPGASPESSSCDKLPRLVSDRMRQGRFDDVAGRRRLLGSLITK